jgi:hypothetical protein
MQPETKADGEALASFKQNTKTLKPSRNLSQVFPVPKA